jgi:hypothetical protein
MGPVATLLSDSVWATAVVHFHGLGGPATRRFTRISRLHAVSIGTIGTGLLNRRIPANDTFGPDPKIQLLVNVSRSGLIKSACDVYMPRERFSCTFSVLFLRSFAEAGLIGDRDGVRAYRARNLSALGTKSAWNWNTAPCPESGYMMRSLFGRRRVKSCVFLLGTMRSLSPLTTSTGC